MIDRRAFCRRAAGAAAVTLAVATATLSPLLTAPAFALTLAEAKRQGLVGERPDGYVGVVRRDAPAEVHALVERINAERRARYAEIARRTNASARDVAILAGSKLIAGAPPGTYVMNAQGAWVRK